MVEAVVNRTENLNLKKEFDCMRKTWVIRVLLLIGYCVPFVFLSVNGDATFGTMLLYGVMIAGFSFLCLVALKTNNVAILYIGNALSFASSYAVAKLSRLELIEHYFKPLLPTLSSQ